MARSRLLVADLVGLTPAVLAHTPRIREMASGGFNTSIETVLPAVTCTAQATLLTGAPPASHGIVGNGWYFRDLDEVLFWRQSRGLIGGDTLFDSLRAAGRTTANLFGWYNWNCGANYSITPKPSYPADGRKFPGIHTEPGELRAELESHLGPFPLFQFWGPGANIASSEWIAKSAAWVMGKHEPDLVFCYIPHLDYDHQRYGPADPRSIRAAQELDRVAADLFASARERGYEILAFSEYAIGTVSRHAFLNRVLRREGWLRVRLDPAVGELPLFGTSRAFAVCDHQIAHVYISNPADVPAVAKLLSSVPEVGEVLDRDAQRARGLDHSRSGELVAIARDDAWFAYNYWLDDTRAPDFARTVDIHRKPGYDPAELFIDPALPWPRLRVAANLAKKALGFRYLMKVISLDPSMVRGSHGGSVSGALALGTPGVPPPARGRMGDLRRSIETLLISSKASS
jgi:predicted AlkP superfamily pyrophosphatase or phosphodiesterase